MERAKPSHPSFLQLRCAWGFLVGSITVPLEMRSFSEAFGETALHLIKWATPSCCRDMQGRFAQSEPGCTNAVKPSKSLSEEKGSQAATVTILPVSLSV